MDKETVEISAKLLELFYRWAEADIYGMVDEFSYSGGKVDEQAGLYDEVGDILRENGQDVKKISLLYIHTLV